MSSNVEVLELLREIAAVDGVRGALIASADGPEGAADYAQLQPATAADVAKTVRRMVVASSAAAAPLRELLINFGPSRMMVRPLAEDAVLIVLLERETETDPIRTLLDLEIERLQQAMRGEPMPAVGVHEGDDEVGELLGGPLGPILGEIEAIYQRYRQRVGHSPMQARMGMHEQIREWLLCCNPSNYTLPLLLDGLSETLVEDAGGRSDFVGEVQELLRRAGALR